MIATGGVEPYLGEGMLELRKDAVVDILRWAERYPTIEVTGMVAAGPTWQRVHPMSNIAREPTRYYEWSPAEMVQAYARMDVSDEQPIAFYHSHPSGKPDPSERDMEGALHVGMHYLIAYPWTREDMVLPGEPNQPVWRLSTWECIEQGILVEASYEVVP
jgi:proteasome lid subunit RPN8/RPN11